MSSIEERLRRDIAAVTGGVVVTDSDLRDARAAVSERIDSQRRQYRRRTVIAAAAAAVVILVLGVVAFQTLRGDDLTAPPANSGPTTSDPWADYLIGGAPTPELVQGVWREDDGTTLIRFSSPNLVSFDERGRMFDNPDVQGRYEITGDRITVSVTGGRGGCAGQEFAMRASVPEPGIMRVVHLQPGSENCFLALDEAWVLEQVVPASQNFAESKFSSEAGWQPLADKKRLYGSWFAEGGGYVLELARSGSYYVADETSEGIDRGHWSWRGGDLTLTSGAGSGECREGDRLVLGGVEYIYPGTGAIRSTMQENTCGAAWTPAAWILIPHEGS